MKDARYVVFDGMDGSGKGTQIKRLEEKLAERVIFTREPGGTLFAEEIRKLVRDNPLAGKSTALNNFLLFWAAREELQENFVLPALQSGKHVFSDRGDSSTYAFQLCGEEHEELFPAFMYMRELVFAESKERHKPDLYIVFDLPADVARERALQDATRTKTHFDVRDVGYYERVRDGFKKFAKYAPVEFIDATRTPEEVHRSVMLLLAKEMIIPEFAFVV
jgi:dTMP kinase